MIDGHKTYLHSDDEGLLNLVYEEMNQPEQEESISVSDKEEYEVDEELDEDEDTIDDDSFTDQQYIECLVACMISRTLKRSLEAYDITGIRPAKSIRLLEVQASGPDRME
ncbi:hypothetical protein RDI58_022053 [Solanum bulbocastanum]|uniref:Uncharacterized protein n=1 Tax=Solanum bulbocastanum TaxID=147425 RepID=A0AAN8T534_SOLBU